MYLCVLYFALMYLCTYVFFIFFSIQSVNRAKLLKIIFLPLLPLVTANSATVIVPLTSIYASLESHRLNFNNEVSNLI